MTNHPMRLRVRPLMQVPAEDRQPVTKQRCLSTPHMGEAIDAASDMYRMRSDWARELHYLHPLGEICSERCLYLDYVPFDQDKDQDELDVAGLVAKAKAG